MQLARNLWEKVNQQQVDKNGLQPMEQHVPYG
jgi:hypothetical protein